MNWPVVWRAALALVCIAASGWAAPATISYREPTASSTLAACYVLYCTGTANCTPTTVLPGSTVTSDDKNGGDDHAASGCSGGCEYGALTINVPITSGQTTACFAVQCKETNANLSPVSATVCCTGGSCS